MSRYISIFFLVIFSSVLMFFLFAPLFDGGDAGETAVYTTSMIIIVLLSMIITILIYLIQLVKGSIGRGKK
ncbi:hypothetical protein LS684_06455 [Cytobacillus spongiae]|jgi:hypothetical protein|uniref:hypothetical protein n=1 Tax=Cytobacillus spongiae TaxID=2901381 RepID=UPI001F26D9A2|nr:hypothetical protein [Cytobacillus spongiae]UII57077.1 hypothetical protein LS684_06455 [Cytobacillus spongiae]